MTRTSIPKLHCNSVDAPLQEPRTTTSIPLYAALALALVAGYALGWLAWGSSRTALLALTLPLVLLVLPGRWSVYAFAAGYQLAVLRGAIGFIGAWFGGPWQGVAAWLAYGVLGSLPWLIAFWCGPKTRTGKVAAVTLGWLLSLVPFFAVVQGGNPLFGWGFALQGWGWWGVAGALLATAAFAMLDRRKQLYILAALIPLCVLISLKQERLSMSDAGHVRAINTSFGRQPGGDREVVDRYLQVGKALDFELSKNDGKQPVYVLPETTLGRFDPTSQHLLNINLVDKLKRHNARAIVGVEALGEEGELLNLALVIDPDGSMYSVRQRNPALVAMWSPWKSESFSIDWLRDTAVDIGNGQVARVVICYEEFLPFITLLDEFRGGHTMVLSLSNAWADGGSGLAEIQGIHSEGMSRLFGRTVVRAVNR